MTVELNADIFAVWERLAEQRRGTFGELAELVRVLGREHFTKWCKL